MHFKDIIEKNLGLSATIEIEGSSHHKLQVKSLISTQLNSTLPAYAPFSGQNSEKLPAQFVLKLSQPLPMLNTSINQIISEINEPATIKEYLTTLSTNSKESLVTLIARQELDLNKGPFCRSVDVFKSIDNDSCDLRKHVYTVKLLDQHHTYHILDSYLERQDGVYVTKIPFTHPTSIPNILRVLRQQALFNFVIGTCIRRNKITNNFSEENSTRLTQESNIFDIIPISLTNICISFEHPSKESLATLEIDLKDLSCQLYALDKDSVCSNEFATKVLQKCWSIPITLRSVLRKCDERRLKLLEDANRRRERELQELLTNNSAQPSTQYKSHLQYQETLLQSKFSSLNDKSNPRDLNSIAEFLSSKINVASTSDASNQTNTESSRSNLLKKFSCKPKAKQNNATKSQTGNKILSLMLKRQNSTTSSNDDANLKATLTKKAKIKFLPGENSVKSQNNTVSTTKLISPEVATAARLSMKQAKQPSSNTNISLSLIRSPNKTQASAISSSSAPIVPIGVCLNPQGSVLASKQPDPTTISSNIVSHNNIRLKTAPTNITNAAKPRKSSIGAVLDKLVGGLTPEQTAGFSNDSNPEISRNQDSSKGGPLGLKTKSRTTADQFAIKQGSQGGLKLTVTKTKPATALSSSTSTSSSSSSSSSSSTSSTSAPIPNLAMTSSSSSSTSILGNNTKSETSKLLSLGSSTPTIKYTIPKISKTQQSSQSGSNQTNTSDNLNSNSVESNSQGDDSSNPSSSATSNAASSSTSNKRTTATPFSRPNASNRNPVSSSTHPLGRTTSNPLSIASRPSSTSSGENHLLNRISSSNQNQQNLRQQVGNRVVNLQQQVVQRMMNPGVVTAQQIPNTQSNQSPVFSLGAPQQSGSFSSNNDISLIAANQAAILAQQRNQNLNPFQQPPGQFMSSSIDANLISSSRPQFAANLPLPMQAAATTNTMHLNVSDSIQRPSPSVINTPPRFYVRQPLFEDNSNTVSSTPKITNEASQSPFSCRHLVENPTPTVPTASLPAFQPRISESHSNKAIVNEMSSSTVSGQQQSISSNQGVSSSSDSGNRDIGSAISTPSSPTECGLTETVPPPPLIPIDSLEEPQAVSPEIDHPDDASDRLSIDDTNENVADSNSVASTPKPSCVNSPLSTQDSNSAMPSSSSRNIDSAISSVNNGMTISESVMSKPPCEFVASAQSTSSEVVASVSQSSISPSEDSNGVSRRPTQSTSASAQSDELVASQSTMAATSNDML